MLTCLGCGEENEIIKGGMSNQVGAEGGGNESVVIEGIGGRNGCEEDSDGTTRDLDHSWQPRRPESNCVYTWQNCCGCWRMAEGWRAGCE